MGAFEAFLIGGLAGGAIGFVVFVALAGNAKGRTSTALFLPAWSRGQVLQVALAYFENHRMRTAVTADAVRGEEGSVWATGIRVLELRARDHPGGGADVWIDAYIRSVYPKEIHLDPKGMFGMIPKRKALELANGLAAALGAFSPAWAHRHA